MYYFFVQHKLLEISTATASAQTVMIAKTVPLAQSTNVRLKVKQKKTWQLYYHLRNKNQCCVSNLRYVVHLVSTMSFHTYFYCFLALNIVGKDKLTTSTANRFQ